MHLGLAAHFAQARNSRSYAVEFKSRTLVLVVGADNVAAVLVYSGMDAVICVDAFGASYMLCTRDRQSSHNSTGRLNARKIDPLHANTQETPKNNDRQT